MYAYTAIDHKILNQRVAQFRNQTNRFLNGELAPMEFLPLRLQNGLYIQRHAPMLRIAVPYGLLSSLQLRKLAHIARHYDKGYGHFTTRQNIQFNWPNLAEVPDILAELAEVEMHAIQTSGNCIRNTTSDQFAGVAVDEIIDPRPYCEIIRQWSTFHPEFAFLPRKFKIAVNGSETDRAAVQVHHARQVRGQQLHGHRRLLLPTHLQELLIDLKLHTSHSNSTEIAIRNFLVHNKIDVSTSFKNTASYR